MNTDNMSVAGETIDYGPCAFLDRYDPEAAFSAIDTQGRYAYRNQPAIGHWNLTRLAECLLPLLSEDEEAAVAEATEALGGYALAFESAYEAGLRRKLGLFTELDGDVALGRDLLAAMEAGGADFTLTFRRLSTAGSGPEGDLGVRSLFADPSAFDGWMARWRERLNREPAEGVARCAAMQSVNPAFIPRNHRVEAVIQAAVEEGDFSPFEELLSVLSQPYRDQPAFSHYAEPPRDGDRVYQTFCGT